MSFDIDMKFAFPTEDMQQLAITTLAKLYGYPEQVLLDTGEMTVPEDDSEPVMIQAPGPNSESKLAFCKRMLGADAHLRAALKATVVS